MIENQIFSPNNAKKNRVCVINKIRIRRDFFLLAQVGLDGK